jgi:hypothetical protein
MTGKTIRLILIRYNKPVEFHKRAAWYTGRSVHLDPDWLNERLRLFHFYCWPSLARQTEEDFQALLFMDQATDPEYVRKLKVDNRIVPVFVDGTVGAGTRQFLKDHWSGATTDNMVHTTRLDSDDALAPTYLEEISNALRNGGKGKYFYFPRGQQYVEASGTYRKYIYRQNSFGTLIEPFDGKDAGTVRTAMSKDHTEFCRQSYARPINLDKAQWCMVIHGGNVLNSIRGTEITSPDFCVGAIPPI